MAWFLSSPYTELMAPHGTCVSYLATLTRDNAVVNTGRLVAAHFARNHLNVGCK